MAAITGSFPPGPYTATYTHPTLNSGAATDIGLMEGPIRHQQSVIGLPIRTNLYAQNVIDYILQGGGVFVVLSTKEWHAGAKALMWGFAAGTLMGNMPLVGTLYSAICGSLILTALAGTPAATVGPVTQTYPLCAILPGHNLDITMGPMERNVPLVIGVLPQKYSTTVGQATYYTHT